VDFLLVIIELFRYRCYTAEAIYKSEKKLCSRLSSSDVRFWRKNGRFAFLSPPLEDLGATYDDHLRLTGKRVVG